VAKLNARRPRDRFLLTPLFFTISSSRMMDRAAVRDRAAPVREDSVRSLEKVG
jgi:hypothetical protein